MAPDPAIDFTAPQVDAIRYKGVDACVVAGPGSGKTTVLVERYRELIDFHHFEPREILAITFTEKAAANMKAKVAEKFRHDEMRLRELESAWISTIHGFCARLLRENAIAAGINPRFAVLDARESDDLQFECLNQALDELVAERREDALSLIQILQTPRIAGDLKNAYDGIRSAGKSIEDVRAVPSPIEAVTAADAAFELRRLVGRWPSRIQLTEARRRQMDALLEWSQTLAETSGFEELLRVIDDCPLHLGRVPDSEKETLRAFKESLPVLKASAVDAHTAPFREIVFNVLARFETLYNERKTLAGALDFNDLERRTIELLRRHQVVADRVRTQFRQVMLDEFQDINEQQAELIRRVRGENAFFAVGDVNQSIYGFRHAQPEIFHAYRREIEEAGKHYTELLDNFRSRAGILRCVEGLLNEAEGIEARELIASAEFGEKAAPSVEILRVFDEDREEACNREARWIAHRILELRGTLQAARDFRDYAVLCRNGDSMKPILEEFDRLRIPYVCGRRQSFLLAREGLDITALLHTVANPRDGIALATVLRSPFVGIGDEALLRMRLLGGSVTGGLNMLAYDGLRLAEFSDDDARKIEVFTADLKRWRADQQIVPLDVLIARMLNDCGYVWTPGDITGDNIEAFLHLARTKGADRTLLEFLGELESVEGAISAESDLSDEDQGNCVQVMTAHAAKGLEFPVTIVAAADKGTQRSSASVTYTPEGGLGIKWNDPFSDDGLKDSWALRNSERLKQREKEEAHRLLYVAMTRAEEHLIVSYSTGKRRPDNWAREVDEFFGLAQRVPTGKAEIVGAAGLEASVLLADTDPPPLDALAAEQRKPAEIIVLPRPVVEDQHDTAVNVTSLAVFASCPRKYYIQRYIGWNGRRFARFDPEELSGDDVSEVGDTEISPAELGSFVHEVLAGKPGPHPAEAQALADVFFGSDLGRRALAASRSAREWDFIADIDGTLVRGTIDLWFEEGGEIYVVDYKTDGVNAAEAPERAPEYAPQLALYALAIERAFGNRPARAYLHFLRPDVVSEVRLDEVLFEHAKELIAHLREAQNDLRFDLNEGPHCEACSFYKSLCPAGLERAAS